MTGAEKVPADFEAWWKGEYLPGAPCPLSAARAFEAGKRAGREAERAEASRCSDCPPVDYPTDETRCEPCDRRAEAVTDAHPLHFTYRNWRGEISERRVVPVDVRFGSTEWHPEPQWFLVANDLDKGETRWFAMRDIGATKPPPDVEALKAAVLLGLDLVSEEKGWGTYPRMEGSEIYADAEAFVNAANAALAALSKPEGK